MDKENNFFVQCVQLVDALLILAGLFLTFPLRNALVPLMDLVPNIKIDVMVVKWTDISVAFFGAIPFLPVILDFFGFYDKMGRVSVCVRIIQLLKALLVCFCGFAVLALVFKFEYQNRSIIAVGITVTCFILLARVISTEMYARWQSVLIEKKPILLIGAGESLIKWKKKIEPKEFEEYSVIDEFDCTSCNCDRLEGVLAINQVEKAIFVTKEAAFSDISKAVAVCEEMGIDACIAADFVNTRITAPKFDRILGVPMLVVRSVPEISWATFGKFVIDKIGAFLLLILSSPAWIVACVGILLSDGRPIFYRQDRAGRFGRPFKMWKFRSMSRDADSKLKQLKLEGKNQMSGPVFKLTKDPRVFPFGAWLRRTSVDELPQLLNVLFGHMSLVGPRPMACYELPDISKTAHRRKLSVKPGITCIWQVEGRNSITDFEEWVELDLKYIDEWSLWLDIKILFKTVLVVLFRKGAS